MKYCPKCGSKIDDNAEFCPVCGEKVENIIVYEEPAEEPSENEVNLMRCKLCGKGVMVVVDTSAEYPLYRCTNCGAYYGEFLKTGKITFYNTLHLKIGRIISTETKLKKYYRISIKKREGGMFEEGISEIAKSITVDLEGYELSEIMDALYYMIEEGILSYKIEDMEDNDEFSWFYLTMEVEG